MSVSRRTVLATAAGAAALGTSTAPATATTADVTEGPTPAPTLRKLRSATDYAVEKLHAVAPTVTAFPVGTKFEKWIYSRNGDWVGGFGPGTLRMAWLYSKDDTFRTRALASAEKLAPRQYDTGTHDLGFLFYRTAGLPAPGRIHPARLRLRPGHRRPDRPGHGAGIQPHVVLVARTGVGPVRLHHRSRRCARRA
ncbi:hypothetical protein [Streptomyces sp. NPDC059010]|uniref:hypothetical protein n=1 Tax=Streptomyces sp. NPDC059010 TaxID=3346695 RepID=UPI0036AFF417